MEFDPEPRISQLAVEIRFNKGLAYYDHCGSLTLALERALGEPFKGNVPDMQYGEVRSELERLVVRFGKASYGVTQTWVNEAARFQMVAHPGWAEVSKKLNVDRHVTRCGARYWFTWAVEDRNTAERLIDGLNITRRGPGWDAFRLSDRGRTEVSVIVREPNVQWAWMRLVVQHGQQETRGVVLPEQRKFAVPHVIFLDLDYVHCEGDANTVAPAQLRGFLAESWTRARDLALRFGQALKDVHAVSS